MQNKTHEIKWKHKNKSSSVSFEEDDVEWKIFMFDFCITELS